MGQLERYGLYVLCLVIFLILGVAIWGGDPAQAAPIDEQGALLDPALAQAADGVAAPRGQDQFFAPLPADDGAVADTQLGLETVAAGTVAAPVASQNAKQQPPVAPVKAGEPAAPGYREYKIKAGDVLGTIAQNELGSVTHEQAIRDLNPGIQDKKMQIGQVLRLPMLGGARAPAPAKEKAKDAAEAGGTYTVVEGDSPWIISRKVFGTGSYADEIIKLNGIRNPKKIKVGSTLELPARQ